MTDKKTIAQLAEFMGWEKVKAKGFCEYSALSRARGKRWYDQFLKPDGTKTRCGHWNPLEDWNHFAQLEERILEDGRGKTCKRYLAYWTSKQAYISSTKRERCDAIISVISND